MTETCRGCGKSHAKKYGPPKDMPSGFTDQIVYCPKCGWCGVVSQVTDADKPKQLQLL